MHEARDWFHTAARISSICFLAGAFSAFAYFKWFRPSYDAEPGGGFGLAMFVLWVLSQTSGCLAVMIPGKRGSKTLSPLWPYLTATFVTGLFLISIPTVR
jgi:hypothetical protein